MEESNFEHEERVARLLILGIGIIYLSLVVGTIQVSRWIHQQEVGIILNEYYYELGTLDWKRNR